MAKKKAIQAGYYLVNPHGTIHIVTREHARSRLGQVGYRLANQEEIKAYHEADGQQDKKNPLATPFSVEPPALPELPPAHLGEPEGLDEDSAPAPVAKVTKPAPTPASKPATDKAKKNQGDKKGKDKPEESTPAGPPAETGDGAQG